MSEGMGCVERTSDVVVFLRASARDIDATILRTRDRLRQSNDRAWRTQSRIASLQECLDRACSFLEAFNE